MLTLSAQGRAVSAFTLAFLLLTGALYRVGAALTAVFDNDFTGRGHAAAAGTVTLLVGAGILWLAVQATASAPDTWTRALAEAARVLAVVGVIIAALALLSTLTHDDPSPFLTY